LLRGALKALGRSTEAEHPADLHDPLGVRWPNVAAMNETAQG